MRRVRRRGLERAHDGAGLVLRVLPPASLTAETWQAQCAEKAARDAEDQARIAASTPQPRDALHAALQRRAEARGALERLEVAQVSARAALAAAQTRFDAAEAAMQTAEQAAVQRAAAGLTGTHAEPAGVTVGAARGGLRTAEDALQAARGAKGLIDDQLHYAKPSLVNAEAAVRRAALVVISSEELENLIELATDARAGYLHALGGLSWLIRNHAVPDGDVRPNQLVREADSAPSQGREAQNADGAMAARLNALLGDRHEHNSTGDRGHSATARTA